MTAACEGTTADCDCAVVVARHAVVVVVACGGLAAAASLVRTVATKTVRFRYELVEEVWCGSERNG